MATRRLEPGADISAAVDEAVDGDEVVLAPGTHRPRRSIDFGGKAITLRGETPDAGPQTVIKPVLAGPALVMTSGETSAAVVSNLTVQDVYGRWGSGILCVNSSPQIEGVHFVNCRNTAMPTDDCRVLKDGCGRGGGVNASDGANLVFRDCVFTRCSACFGGTIYAARRAVVTLSGCRFDFSSNSCPVLDPVYIGISARVIYIACHFSDKRVDHKVERDTRRDGKSLSVPFSSWEIDTIL